MRRNRSHRRSCLVALALAALCLSCAPIHYPDLYPMVDRAVEVGNKEDLGLSNPFALDDQIRDTVSQEVGLWGSPYDRVRRTLRFMNDRGFLGFQYDKDVTVGAQEAFRSHRGNCMSYTGLFVAIARHLKVPVFFVHVAEATSFYEKGGTFVVSSHMAIGYDSGIRITLVDLGGESDRLRVYERIDDLAAFCYFYNNVAVEKMLDGDLDGAEALWKYLLRIGPARKETLNNLGTLYIREGRFDEALELYSGLLQGFPDFRPAYNNATIAARGAGRADLVKQFAETSERLAQSDPFYLFNQGINFLQQGSYSQAETAFRRAARMQPRNPLLFLWLAKTYLLWAKREEGLTNFKKALELAPNHPMVEELRRQFPELSEVPAPPMK